jgi:hypothetical protein
VSFAYQHREGAGLEIVIILALPLPILVLSHFDLVFVQENWVVDWLRNVVPNRTHGNLASTEIPVFFLRLAQLSDVTRAIGDVSFLRDHNISG